MGNIVWTLIFRLLKTGLECEGGDSECVVVIPPKYFGRGFRIEHVGTKLGEFYTFSTKAMSGIFHVFTQECILILAHPAVPMSNGYTLYCTR